MNPFKIGMLNYDFVVKQSNIPTLLGFISWWEQIGRGTDVALHHAAKRFDGRIWVGIVNYDYCSEIFHRHGITVVPTLIMLENGNQVKRFEGFNNSNDVDNFVLEYLGLTDKDVPEVYE